MELIAVDDNITLGNVYRMQQGVARLVGVDERAHGADPRGSKPDGGHLRTVPDHDGNRVSAFDAFGSEDS